MKILKLVLLGILMAGVAAGVGGIVGSGATIAFLRSGVAPVDEEEAPPVRPLVVHSEALGQTLTLGVRVPVEYGRPGVGSIAVLWVLDGPSQGASTLRVNQALSRIGGARPAIVVEVPASAQGRRHDFLPEEGGQSFLSFLEMEARPALQEVFGAEGEQILVGHSLGGLFALFAATKAGAPWDGYFAFSPALWAGDERVETGLSALPGQARGQVPIFVSVGAEEGPRLRGDAERVRQALSRGGGAGGAENLWRVEVTPGADHLSNPELSLPVALNWFWARRSP